MRKPITKWLLPVLTVTRLVESFPDGIERLELNFSRQVRGGYRFYVTSSYGRARRCPRDKRINVAREVDTHVSSTLLAETSLYGKRATTVMVSFTNEAPEL